MRKRDSTALPGSVQFARGQMPQTGQSRKPQMIIRARVVITMDGPPIENGAVAVSGDRIHDVAKFSDSTANSNLVVCRIDRRTRSESRERNCRCCPREIEIGRVLGTGATRAVYRFGKSVSAR